MASMNWEPLWISLGAATVATVIAFFLGVIAAYGMLNYRGRWKSLIESFFIAPMVLPPTVTGFLLLLLCGKNGPVGHVTAFFDFTIIFTWYAVVIAAVVVAFPLMYRTALGAFEQVNPSLLLVAQTLASSRWRVFLRIVLPLSFPGLIAGTTLTFARALGEFGATLMLAGNIPGQTQTVPMAIYFAVEAGDFNEAWFWAAVILTISGSGIVAANFWVGYYKNRTFGSPSQLESKETSSSVSKFTKPLLRQSLSCLDGSSDPASDNNPPRLNVAITKRLPQFHLDVFFSADQEALGLLGASGSGKSMILRCIAGLDTPNQGHIAINGVTVFDAKRNINIPSYRRKVGLLLQDYALFPHMTVAQNVGFGLHELPPDGRSHRIRKQLSLVQLEGFENRYPHQLSGGQQQRAALARALAMEPNILLLDEPFSALDSHLRNELEKQLIRILSSYAGPTLFVSHNLEEAYRVCQRLLVLERGTIAVAGAKQTIFDRPEKRSIAQLTGCKNYSAIQTITSHSLHAPDWNCTLSTAEAIAPSHAYVGIRAHHIIFWEEQYQSEIPANVFSAWVVWTSETPHRMTVYLKIGAPPAHAEDYHLQAEVFKDRWRQLQLKPMPWLIHLQPERLLLLQP